MWASACKQFIMLLYAWFIGQQFYGIMVGALSEIAFLLLLPVVLNYVRAWSTCGPRKKQSYKRRPKRAPPNLLSRTAVHLRTLAASIVSGTLSNTYRMLENLIDGASSSKANRDKSKYSKENKQHFRNKGKSSSRNFHLRYSTSKQFKDGLKYVKLKYQLERYRTSFRTKVGKTHKNENVTHFSKSIPVASWRWKLWAMKSDYDSDTLGTKARFDTDSYAIMIDSGCSRTISGYKSDFIKETMVQKTGTNQGVHGFSGSISKIEAMGTIMWSTVDDDGSTRNIMIPNSLYVPTTKNRLLSPQHLTQETKDAVQFTIKAQEAKLSWFQKGKSTAIATKSIKINQDASNVATLWATPGYKRYKAFEARMPQANEQPFIHIDKGSLMELADQLRDDPYKIDINTELWKQSAMAPLADPLTETYLDIKKPEDAKLLWHQRLGHISMERINRLSNLGYLPSFLAKCPNPICQACIYGKMTRRPWRNKPSLDDEKSSTATASGITVSVDQLESPILGFYAQMKGKITKRRYRAATIFVDHHSDYTLLYSCNSLRPPKRQSRQSTHSNNTPQVFRRKHSTRSCQQRKICGQLVER